MFSRRILLFSLCFWIPTFVISQTPTVTTPETASISETETATKCVKYLSVTEPDGDGYLCDLETASTPFKVQKIGSDPEFCLYYITGGTLTPPQYDLDVSCTDKDGKGNTGTIRVYVVKNSPPNVTDSPSVTVPVDVTAYTSGAVYKIQANDVDNDALKFTTTTGHADFSVDQNTGEIFPLVDPRTMTATSASLTVAVDDGIAGHSPISVNVILQLTNLNVAPVLRNYAGLSGGVSIQEDHAPGDLFSLDVDDSFAKPKVTVSGTVDPATGTSLFEFNDANPYSVKLAAGKKFDFATQSSYTVNVTLFDGFLSSTTYSIPITIVDVNDPPVFTQATYAVEVDEGAANTVTFTPAFGVTDPESAAITYSMGTASQSSMFSIDSSTGALTNTVTLDYEDAGTPKPIQAEVCASDPSGAKSCVTVDVTLKDVNDNSPEFAAGTYTHKVSMKTTASTQFQQLVATDKDSNENADIEYSLVSSSSPGLFDVVNGYVILAKAIDVPYGTPLSCVVKATDKGTNPGPKSTEQTVSFTWNEPPSISSLPLTKSLAQDTAAGTFVHSLVVADPESDTYTCAIKSSTPASAPFTAQIESGTQYGIKFTGGTLDSTQTPTYTLSVECSDGNGGSDVKDLVLNVEANQPPTSACTPSASQTLDASTSITANSAVYNLSITDPENDPITITINSETPSTGTFRVNQATRQLEVTKDLRAEEESSYTLDIQISDGKNAAVTCALTVSITNLNVAPVITNDAQSVSWSENTAVGTSLFQFSVTDTDNITVSMSVDPASGSGFFEFDPATNKVNLKSGLDYETMADKSFNVSIDVSDGFRTTTGYVHVDITDDNDPPVFNSNTFTATINEGATLSAVFDAAIAYTDHDAGDTHTVTILPGPYSNMFSITDPTTGKMTNVLELDVDAGGPTEMKLNISVTDTAGLTDTAEVIITVTEINDNDPLFDATNPVTPAKPVVGLSTPSTTVIATLSATDLDLGDQGAGALVYSMVTSSTECDYFTVNPTTGAVTLNKALIASMYGTLISCQIKVEDKRATVRSSTYQLDIGWNESPVIDNLPMTKSLAQDTAAGTFVQTLDVSDAENDTYSCVMTATTPDPAPFAVEIESGTKYGVKFTGGTLDSKVTPTYTVTVECSDGNGGKDSKVLTLNVQPNQPPTSSCSPAGSVTIDASTSIPANSEVYDLNINDPDNDAISITLASSTPSTGMFKINAATQKLEVTKDIRSEVESSYSLDINISDSKNPAVTCALSVSISNLNAAPLLNNNAQTVSWSENTAVGSSLFSFDIVDTDNVTVTMSTDPASGSSLFELDPATNQVKLKSGLNYETMTDKTFNVSVVMSDGFKTTNGYVTIEITDDNDAPVFTSNTFTATIDEGATLSSAFNAAIAFTDEDATDSHTITILPGADGGKFSVTNPATGMMTNIADLDVDAAGSPTEMTYNIKVTDSGGLTSTAKVTVTIKEINDNDPLFDATNPVTPKEVVVGLTTPATTVIATMSASDLDLGDKGAGALVYSMASTSTECGYFSVNPTAGTVTLNKPLVSSLYGKLMSCQIKVEDKRATVRSSTYQLDIGWNKPPKIDNLKDQVDVVESLNYAKELFSVAVTDPENDNYFCYNKVPTVPVDIPFEVRKNADKDFRVWYTNSKSLNLATGDSQYTLTVICEDVEGGKDTKDLVINVKKNQPPTLDCQPAQDLPPVDAGTTGANVNIHTITATEPEGENVAFRLSSITPGSAFFSLDRSGKITTTGELKRDSSAAKFVTLEVVAEDPEKNAATCVITIPLTNINKAPVMESLPKTVSAAENLAAGSELYSIKLTDSVLCSSDITVNWKLENYPELASKFDVVVTGTTASVKLASGQTLDFEDPIFAGQPPMLRFTFTASDGCLTSLKSELRVEIEDINEDPVMRNGLKYSAKFYENDTDVSVKLGCDVFDVDKDDILKITLTGTNADKFKVTDPKNCVLTKTKEFDLDTGANVQSTIKMIVEDKEGLKVEADIDLVILEANEHTPIYTTPATSYTINEGDPAGRVLGTMAAKDDDLAGSLDSSLTHTIKSMSPATGSQYVTMDSNGEIKIKEPLDGKVANGETFKLEIEVCDQGYPKKCSLGYVDVQYIVPPTTPPPPPVTQDPNANNNNNNGGSGSGSGTDGSGSGGSLLDNPGIIAMMALLLAAGAGLIALGIFGAYKLWSRGACGKGKTKTPNHYDVNERGPSRGSNTSRGSNRVRDSTDIQMTEAPDTQWVYTGTSLEYEPGYVSSVPSVEQPVNSSIRLL